MIIGSSKIQTVLASLVVVCAVASPALAASRPEFARPPGIMWEAGGTSPSEPMHIPTGSEADYRLSTGAKEAGGTGTFPDRQVIPYDIPVVYNGMVDDFIGRATWCRLLTWVQGL